MKIFMPCVFLATSVSAYFEGPAVHQLTVQSNAEASNTGQRKKPDRKQRVMDAISQFRAEICGDMKKEHGKKFASHEACEKFMMEACKPGKDGQMDGDSKEVTTQKGHCSAFFPEAKKKAEELIDKEDKEAEEKAKAAGAPSSVPSAAPSGAPSPGPASDKNTAPAPAPVAGDTPAPAPISAPAPARKIPDDEKYYYAKGGKDPDRLHMNEELKLPDQGYWGKLVEHEDQETVTADWGKEFGPRTGGSFRKFCDHHPNNPWCAQHQSGARLAAAFDVVQLVLVALVAIRTL